MTSKKGSKEKNKPQKLLTEVELELMHAIWTLGEATVKEVQSALPKERALAYTSVATMMKILEGKGALTSRKTDRAHVYVPEFRREDYEARTLRHVADSLFQGSPSNMVLRLLDDGDLSRNELEEIRKILEERLPK